MTEAIPEERTESIQEAAHLREQISLLEESLADAELALDDRGWQRITSTSRTEFSHEGLKRAAQLSRIMSMVNPLVKRGLSVRQAYVWGQGVQIQARAMGDSSSQDVNKVVQEFIDDPGNKTAVFGSQAQEENERALGTDGNLFIAAFTNQQTGYVRVRTIEFEEITRIITNPNDKDEPWYYERRWTQDEIGDLGTVETNSHVVWYPAINYEPDNRPERINGVEVLWDTPVLHISVNRQNGTLYGIGDAYASLAWARAYKDFLEDWSVLMKALSQFAWRLTSKKNRGRNLAALQRTPEGNIPANTGHVGATVGLSEGASLEAIPKTGATIDSDSGRPLAAMVATGLGIPVTTILSDPGVTGARAVAETLEAPMLQEFRNRRALWESALRTLLNYVVRRSVEAAGGDLQGKVIRDDNRFTVQLTGDADPTVEIIWPTNDDTPVQEIMDAIVKADSTGKIPPIEVAKLILKAFKIKDPDEIIQSMTDEQGNFISPDTSTGQAIIDEFRRSGDVRL